VSLPEWFEDWQAWLALAIVLGVAELFSLDLVLLMLAVGSLVGVVVALVGAPLAAQVLAAVAASVAMLAFVRPNVVRRLHSGPDLVLGHNALIGKQAVVVHEVGPDGGQIRVAGELWTARPYDETTVIPVGAHVDVLQIKGATALVHPIPELDV
jgi:membrane protein implicated in regulation of membrane protease activity